MKNISQIKIMLPLILGLGGVVQGSSLDNGASSHSSTRGGPAKGLHANKKGPAKGLHANRKGPAKGLHANRKGPAGGLHANGKGPAKGLHANVPNEEDPLGDQRRIFCQNHYLIHDASSDNFVIVDNQGTIVFPPKENIFLPSGELAGLKCIKLPLRLFEQFLPQEDDSNFYYDHHWMEMYNDDEKEKIHRQTEHQNRHMSFEGNNFIFVLAQAFISTRLRFRENYVVVDGQGRFFRCRPRNIRVTFDGNEDVGKLPRVNVPRAIFEKLTKNPVFTTTALQEIEAVCGALVVIGTVGIGLSHLPINCIIGLGYALAILPPVLVAILPSLSPSLKEELLRVGRL
jgi:hypothetical protein